jgi:cell wall-associated NlpC family hydrolase
MTADDAISAARECLGTPFLHQGRLKGVGLDCAGLGVIVAQSIGAKHRDLKAYGRDPYKGLLKETLDNQQGLKRVKRDSMLPGDLLLLRFGRQPQHLAIYTGTTIIHAYETVGMVCEHSLDERWLARIIGVYRFKVLS